MILIKKGKNVLTINNRTIKIMYIIAELSCNHNQV